MGIPPGSRRDFGRRDFSSRRESRRDLGKILAGSEIPGGQNLTGIVLRISPRFSPGSKNLAAKISPGSCCESWQDSRREAKIPAAKISARSCREAHQDSRREAIILAVRISPESYRESRQVSRREANSWWQKSRAILPGISPRLATGSEILGSRFEHCGNLVTNFFWIEPNVYGLR